MCIISPFDQKGLAYIEESKNILPNFDLKLFWSRFNHSFCKLDHFSALRKIVDCNEMV